MRDLSAKQISDGTSGDSNLEAMTIENWDLVNKSDFQCWVAQYKTI